MTKRKLVVSHTLEWTFLPDSQKRIRVSVLQNRLNRAVEKYSKQGYKNIKLERTFLDGENRYFLTGDRLETDSERNERLGLKK